MKRTLRAALLAVLPIAASAAQVAVDAPSDQKWVIGAWHGSYRYSDKKEPVEFALFFIQRGADLTGHVAEPATFGKGAPYLIADLVGQISRDGSITFRKTYDGTGEVAHSVDYSGQLSADGKRITGTWKIGDDISGAFEMTACRSR